MVENAEAKDFIATCVFFRIFTFFIKIKIWHRIFSTSFTIYNSCSHWITILWNLKNDRAFTNKFLIILKRYVHYLRHIFTNQKLNVKAGVHSFRKIKNTDSSKLQLLYLRNSWFSLYALFQKIIIVLSEDSFNVKPSTFYLTWRWR